MAANFGYIKKPAGILKMATLILGVASLAFGAYGYDRSFYNELRRRNDGPYFNIFRGQLPDLGREIFFLFATAIAFLLSLVYFIVHLITDKIADNKNNNLADTVFQVVCGLLVFIGAAVLINSAVVIENNGCRFMQTFFPLAFHHTRCQLRAEKVIGGVIGLLNGVVYCIAAFFVYKYRNRFYNNQVFKQDISITRPTDRK